MTYEQTEQLKNAFYWVHIAKQKRPEFQCVIDYYEKFGRYAKLKKPYERNGYNCGRSAKGPCRNFRGAKAEKYNQRKHLSPWCKLDENQRYIAAQKKQRKRIKVSEETSLAILKIMNDGSKDTLSPISEQSNLDSSFRSPSSSVMDSFLTNESDQDQSSCNFFDEDESIFNNENSPHSLDPKDKVKNTSPVFEIATFQTIDQGSISQCLLNPINDTDLSNKENNDSEKMENVSKPKIFNM